MEDELAKIGEPLGESPPAIFELVLDDHVPYVNPADYGLDVSGIKPHDYFITSGDAIQKAVALERDLWRHAGDVRRIVFEQIAQEHKCTVVQAQELFRRGVRPKKPRRLAEYESIIWRSAGQCRRLRTLLIKARGENIFMETEWSNHRLLCLPKNPRIRCDE